MMKFSVFLKFRSKFNHALSVNGSRKAKGYYKRNKRKQSARDSVANVRLPFFHIILAILQWYHANVKKKHHTTKYVKFCKHNALHDEGLYYVICMTNFLAYLQYTQDVCGRVVERGFVVSGCLGFFPICLFWVRSLDFLYFMLITVKCWNMSIFAITSFQSMSSCHITCTSLVRRKKTDEISTKMNKQIWY